METTRSTRSSRCATSCDAPSRRRSHESERSRIATTAAGATVLLGSDARHRPGFGPRDPRRLHSRSRSDRSRSLDPRRAQRVRAPTAVELRGRARRRHRRSLASARARAHRARDHPRRLECRTPAPAFASNPSRGGSGAPLAGHNVDLQRRPEAAKALLGEDAWDLCAQTVPSRTTATPPASRCGVCAMSCPRWSGSDGARRPSRARKPRARRGRARDRRQARRAPADPARTPLRWARAARGLSRAREDDDRPVVRTGDVARLLAYPVHP